ncbi:MAG: hypothetical protein N3A62_03135 [Thermodesulfovibrionales bacterium]|nr:hypothetical protein [Thermodesulfovibrionales bacterium]
MSDTKFRLAQLIIQRLDGDRLGDSNYEKTIKDYVSRGCGGFIIFGGRREVVRRFIKELEGIAKHPLFIASDIECGLARQIKETTQFPCQMALASALYPSKQDTLIKMLNAIADECLYVGINMPLIPVLDVNQNPNNPIIATRAFSDDVEVVSWFVPFYADVFKMKGLIGVCKHFPGHGDTSLDSHILLPTINKTKDALESVDLKPFKTAIDEGFQGVMVGHLKIPCLDDTYPASLSKSIVTNLLRQGMGFDGLVLSDAMNMEALKGFKNIYAMALNAGIDVILHPHDFDGCLQSLCDAIDEGVLGYDVIDTAFERVMKARYQKREHNDLINLEYHEQLSSIIYGMSTSLLKPNDRLLPLHRNDFKHVFICDESGRNDSTPTRRFFKDVVTSQQIPSIKGRNVVVAIFTIVSAWHGSSGISDEGINVIQKIISLSDKTVIISFGSPYVLRFFGDADILIAAYEPTPKAQENAMKCLFEGKRFNTNLPVRIDFMKPDD